MGEEGKGGAIPVIDMEEIPFQHAKLREVCEGLGCFRIVNHGVPSELMSEMKRVVRSLLDLAVEVKKRSMGAHPGSGYLGHGGSNTAYESLGIYDWDSPGAVELFCSQLDASPHQRETVQKYVEAVSGVAKKVANKVAAAMGLKGSDYIPQWPCQFRLNKYSFTSKTVGSLGIKIHTDPGFLSILQDDEVVGGLEAEDSSGSFMTVDPCPGSFLVNLGDMAVVWSNGRLHNIKHRVLCKDSAVRISIGGFMEAPEGLLIEAPTEFVDCHHPRLYVPIEYMEYKKVRDLTRYKMKEPFPSIQPNHENTTSTGREKSC